MRGGGDPSAPAGTAPCSPVWIYLPFALTRWPLAGGAPLSPTPPDSVFGSVHRVLHLPPRSPAFPLHPGAGREHRDPASHPLPVLGSPQPRDASSHRQTLAARPNGAEHDRGQRDTAGGAEGRLGHAGRAPSCPEPLQPREPEAHGGAGGGGGLGVSPPGWPR